MKHLLSTTILPGLSICLLFAACRTQRPITQLPTDYPAFYKEGHRGTRGLMPENTIPALEKGLSVGANVLEVDVYTTRDGKVLVVHDPYANANFTRTADGKDLTKEEGKQYIWHQMDYADIRKLDVGTKVYPAFPQQQKFKTYMPLLGELIDSVEAYAKAQHLPLPVYNIELKNSPSYDGQYNATPAELVKAVMEVVKTKKLGHRFYLQSFDARTLRVIHQDYPRIICAYLTGNKDFDKNMQDLGFAPLIYSPSFNLVTPELVQQCHDKNMKLVPWTVNTKEDMQKMIDLGVDGIITDYPNVLAELVRE